MQVMYLERFVARELKRRREEEEKGEEGRTPLSSGKRGKKTPRKTLVGNEVGQGMVEFASLFCLSLSLSLSLILSLSERGLSLS